MKISTFSQANDKLSDNLYWTMIWYVGLAYMAPGQWASSPESSTFLPSSIVNPVLFEIANQLNPEEDLWTR